MIGHRHTGMPTDRREGDRPHRESYLTDVLVFVLVIAGMFMVLLTLALWALDMLALELQPRRSGPQ